MNSETKRELKKASDVYHDIVQVQMEDYFYRDFIVFSLDMPKSVKNNK